MDAKEKYKLRKFIEELEVIKGRHTELVSVYIPTGYELNKIIAHLKQEQDTASNIKDKTNRQRVQDSLEKMIRHLRLFKKTPDNGLAVFSGNASGSDTKVDLRVWSIEPPEKVTIRMYRCDQTFVLDLLKEMTEHKEVYGLIVLDKREANVGLLKGTYVEQIAHFDSDVPGKTTKGGQSQQRFARLRDIAAHEFFKKVGDAINKAFLEMKELKGIIIGGPGPTKEEFLKGDYLNNELKKKVIGVEDLGYTGEFGLDELVDKSQSLLAKEAVMEEKKIVQEFLTLLASEPNKVAYNDDVDTALGYGAVKILLLSDSLDSKTIEKYEKKVEETGAEVRLISGETREGKQLEGLGGKGAILRFAIK